MTSYFTDSGLSASDVALHWLGGIAPPIVRAIYPMEALTAWHAKHHLSGLTGRWMDTGSVLPGGVVRGPFHRLLHGHHLFEDGLKVLINKELRFGEFLHHLGLDSLTAQGIPNPLVPSAVARALLDMGFSHRFVSELLTINVPKILSGSVGLLCAGSDVLAAFSDAIPHTFLASGAHFLTGTLELIFGCYPPNILLLTAGASEIAVGAVTAFRAIVDPVIPALHAPMSVFLPALGHSMGLSVLVAACTSFFTGRDWRDTSKILVASAAASAVSTTVTFMAGGSSLAPLLGPAAGLVTFLLVRKALGTDNASPPKPIYTEYANFGRSNFFSQSRVIPVVFGPPQDPIGVLKGSTLYLYNKTLARRAGDWS